MVAERLDLAIKPVSLRAVSKQTGKPVVPIRQSPDRAFDRQWTVFDIAKKSDFPAPPPSAIATTCFSLATSKAKKFTMLPRCSLSLHEGGCSGLDSETVWRAHQDEPARGGHGWRDCTGPGPFPGSKTDWRRRYSNEPLQAINVKQWCCGCTGTHTLESWSIEVRVRARSNR
jgi:hypothetical protein